ncbi:histidine--tRNA ligase [Desulfobacterota bacterium AH_259_B03_O07]|nr:histidine--tRNA ligase [Desulfobacterota bacterium AH_259_B03_O07]
MKVRSIRGFKDILPDSIKRWHYIEDSAGNIFELYGFSEIRIPVVEFTDIFARSIGTSTDIVEKEMYSFTDRDGSSITLRPEGTAGVVRAYIENSLYAKSTISKLYYMGMMFRHERPQKGRYRGFYQIGAELFGTKDPYADSEIILMLWRFLEKIEVTSLIRLELSSLGDENCRPSYKQKLVKYLRPLKNELCENCQRRLEVNPLRILDCKEKKCKEISKDAPSMLDNLCDNCNKHLDHVKDSLENFSIKYILNPRIVRGLDYYTRTVFEIKTDELGAQNAVAAGGRYDGLVEELGGPPTPAVGFSIGMERLVLLHEKIVPVGFQKGVDAFIAFIGKDTKKTAFQFAYDFRKQGISVEMEYENKSLKTQLKKADKLGAKYAIIVGEEELARGKVKVRNMGSSSEEEINIDKVKQLSIKLSN